MTNPFIIAVDDIPTGVTDTTTRSGASPVRWGGEMFAVEENTPVTVEAILTNLGESVMVQATVRSTATATCARCLSDFTTPVSYDIAEVFGFSPDFIQGDADDEDADEPRLVEDDTVDITQLVIDEAGLQAPFSPVCTDFDQDCDEATPEPDGDVDTAEAEAAEAIDPRWAGLAKFAHLSEEGDSSDNDA